MVLCSGATADSGPGKEETKVQKEAGKDHGQPKPTVLSLDWAGH